MYESNGLHQPTTNHCHTFNQFHCFKHFSKKKKNKHTQHSYEPWHFVLRHFPCFPLMVAHDYIYHEFMACIRTWKTIEHTLCAHISRQRTENAPKKKTFAQRKCIFHCLPEKKSFTFFLVFHSRNILQFSSVKLPKKTHTQYTNHTQSKVPLLPAAVAIAQEVQAVKNLIYDSLIITNVREQVQGGGSKQGE